MHVHDIKTGSVLKWSIVVMLALALAEGVAGYLAGSLALLSDAGHNFTDSLALVLAWFAFYVQSKPPTKSKTYGYHRAGVLAAFVNALLLVGIALYIFYEAYERLLVPRAVNPQWMMVVGGRWHRVCRRRRGLARPAAPDSRRREPPRGIHPDAVVSSLRRIAGVEEIHDVHIWSLGSQNHAMSCHVSIANIPPSESTEILQRINSVLDDEYHISHTPIQFEHAACEPSPKCYAPEEDTLSHRAKRH